jgi:hypothetical protein
VIEADPKPEIQKREAPESATPAAWQEEVGDTLPWRSSRKAIRSGKLTSPQDPVTSSGWGRRQNPVSIQIATASLASPGILFRGVIFIRASNADAIVLDRKCRLILEV